MPSNASGFVDFNEFAALNGDEERRLMEEAMARAESQDAFARRRLTQTTQEGIATGAESLTQVGSYSDYLKAKRDAKNAWAAVTQSTGDVRTDALRESQMGRRANAMAQESSSELAGRETEMGGRVGEAFRGASENRDRQAAFAAQQEQMRGERAKSDADARQRHFQSMWGDVYRQNRQWNPNVTQQEQGQRAAWLRDAMDAGQWQPQGLQNNQQVTRRWLDQTAREKRGW